MTTIVVGGGIIGATTARELARAGEDVLLLEAGRIAGGSTGASAAIVRTHYSNPDVVRMAVRSREAFARAPELLGCEPFYDRRGWLFLVDEADAQLARDNRRMQLAEGAWSDEVDPADLLDGVSTEGIAYALYEANSGFADPVAATRAYVEAARREGARVREDAAVDEVEPGRGVRVHGELLEADAVVLAAGAWTSGLTAPLGLELPLETPREQEVVLEGTVEHAVSSQADRVYMRPDGDGRMVVGRGYPKTYDDVDPDDCHCFKLAPAIGQLVAGAILDRPVDYADVRSFALSRFAEGREFRSTYGGNRA